jgi:hypothetical protein
LTLLQYRRKARDVQPPVAATTSGGTPESSKETAPPMRKEWPEIRAIPGLLQALVTNEIKSFLIIGDQEPEGSL